MSDKIALITGVSGQDGSYLAEFLLDKGYKVHGIVRRNSDFTSKRIDPFLFHENFTTHYGDVVDTSSLHFLLQRIQPTEVYNLAAQSHVGISFSIPDYSSQVNALGTLRLLSAIREVGINARFYQASTSELFGGLSDTAPQNEATPFTPRSPYATSKLFALWTTVNYRDAYGFHVSNGILFNHESPRRGRNFVTKKISTGVAKIIRGEQSVITLGNLSAVRDWGYAPEYVEAMWLMLQQPEPDDYVVGTGTAYSVRDFVQFCFNEMGIEIIWRGTGVNEVGVNRRTGQILVNVDERYFRPSEVETLQADPKKIHQKIGWKAKILAPDLAGLMVKYDLEHTEYGHPDSITTNIKQTRDASL
jgi:GDPmannose 4,6-dehydratase